MKIKGFTLVELMVAAAILMLVLAGILISYITCLELSELAKNSSIAVRTVENKVEEIQNTQFSQIKVNYNNVTFTSANLNGIGVTYVDDTDPDLLLITTTFCWRQPNGRIIGEDTDLDGQLDAGEDLNGNGLLDSIVTVATHIFQG